ncbi:MAG: glycoside hydrolase family 25 protein [Lewinellaceae bacterium]|nr:glycoside hydrolase family 25 protein [Saprospiraceae bacterium]MCB9337689.1 glycoside hydrolase family 25 protein [Lewinellaceae bacterium]
MNSKKRHIILLGAAILLFGCNEQTVRKEGFGVHGIDVSHYQKHIDWQAIAAQDVQFAFVKATEGETFQDTLFCKNWLEIKEAGIKRGAYHFFRPTVPAATQANNFLSWITLSNGDLAPVLDVEVVDGVSPDDLRAGIHTWLDIVENTYKIKPIIYTHQKFFNNYLAGYFTDYPIWIARYTSWRKPCLDQNHEWAFWQYGNRGRLQGINGDVDFNVFRGSLAELEQYCLIRPRPLLDPSNLQEEVVAANP